MISIDHLRVLIHLDADTGVLTWKRRDESYFNGSGGRYTPERAARAWNTRYAGKPALCAPHRMGYLTGKLLYRDFLAHRVVWALHHGKWPEHTIDHINGIKTDNRPDNLRDVEHAVNMRNQKARSTNTTGSVGVFHRKQHGKYDASMTVSGKKVHIGTFDNMDDAVAARANAGTEAGFHENHGRKSA